MIGIITGKPGSGKTFVLASLARDWLKEGRHIYTNFKLNVSDDYLDMVHYYNDPSTLINVEKGVILMDEVHVYFNSRNWERMPMDMQRKLQQHRKDGLDIWGTVQNEARIDVVMRELVSEFYKCRKIFGFMEDSKMPLMLIRVEKYYPEDLKKSDNKNVEPESVSYKGCFFNRDVFDFYDSYAKIDMPEQRPYLEHITAKCRDCDTIKIIHNIKYE